MATTLISDVIVPQVFNPYVVQKTAELSELSQSGIISNDPELDALALQGGKAINMPFWTDLTGASQVLSDSAPLVPAKLTSGQDTATLIARGNAWSVNDLAKSLSGDDPMAAIGNRVAAYWARDRQTNLFSILKGVFASASMVGNVLDISALTGALANINGTTFIDAQGKLGDAAEKLTAVAMHSGTYQSLQKQNLITFIPNSVGVYNIPTYLGKQVIVDDGCPQAAGVYTTYLFGQGAIGLGNGAAPIPTEMTRDVLAGNDILVNRQHVILHPRGVKFTSVAVAGATPTNVELETATNWTKVYDNKNIRIVKFVHKLG